MARGEVGLDRSLVCHQCLELCMQRQSLRAVAWLQCWIKSRVSRVWQKSADLQAWRLLWQERALKDPAEGRSDEWLLACCLTADLSAGLFPFCRGC